MQNSIWDEALASVAFEGIPQVICSGNLELSEHAELGKGLLCFAAQPVRMKEPIL